MDLYYSYTDPARYITAAGEDLDDLLIDLDHDLSVGRYCYKLLQYVSCEFCRLSSCYSVFRAFSVFIHVYTFRASPSRAEVASKLVAPP